MRGINSVVALVVDMPSAGRFLYGPFVKPLLDPTIKAFAAF